MNMHTCIYIYTKNEIKSDFDHRLANHLNCDRFSLCFISALRLSELTYDDNVLSCLQSSPGKLSDLDLQRAPSCLWVLYLSLYVLPLLPRVLHGQEEEGGERAAARGF